MQVLVSAVAAVLVLLAGGAVASPDVAPVAGACKSVSTFTASAAPAFRSAGCLGCHGGAMPGATTAFDLTSVGKNDVAACAQVLKKIDVANKPASALFQVTTGSLPHAGGKVPDAAGFTRAVHGWIDHE